MPPRSVSAVFGTFNGEGIVGTTAIRCLGATQEPFRFTAMPRLKFFHGHALPSLVRTGGVYDGMADTSMWPAGLATRQPCSSLTNLQTFCIEGFGFERAPRHYQKRRWTTLLVIQIAHQTLSGGIRLGGR